MTLARAAFGLEDSDATNFVSQAGADAVIMPGTNDSKPFNSGGAGGLVGAGSNNGGGTSLGAGSNSGGASASGAPSKTGSRSGGCGVARVTRGGFGVALFSALLMLTLIGLRRGPVLHARSRS